MTRLLTNSSEHRNEHYDGHHRHHNCLTVLHHRLDGSLPTVSNHSASNSSSGSSSSRSGSSSSSRSSKRGRVGGVSHPKCKIVEIQKSVIGVSPLSLLSTGSPCPPPDLVGEGGLLTAIATYYHFTIITINDRDHQTDQDGENHTILLATADVHHNEHYDVHRHSCCPCLPPPSW